MRAVLFDLDDTLFDHQYSTRAALEAVRGCHDCFRAVAFDELDRTHARFLEELHHDVTFGRIALDDARRERFRRLFEAMGVAADASLTAMAAAAYRERYQTVRRAIDGAGALLTRRSRIRGLAATAGMGRGQQKKAARPQCVGARAKIVQRLAANMARRDGVCQGQSGRA